MKALIPLIIFLLILTSFSGCLGDEDSDNDGLPDSLEREGWSIYVTSVGENVSHEVHVTSSTHKKDTDGDGLTDFQEWSSSSGGYVTNPREKDTDGDGLTDYEEIMVYGTDPLDWRDDIDKDNGWWDSDYDEVQYYKSRGIDDATIKQFLNNSDVDGDVIKDGSDIDPLEDLKVKITIKSVRITSDMDDSDDLLETIFDVTTDAETKSSSLFYIPVGVNYSVNISMVVDLNDMGIPGEYNNSISINVVDQDKGLEYKPLDIDGLPGIDVIKITPSGSYAKNNFDINSDCGNYSLSGPDGSIWFSIEDVSIPYS